MKVCLVSNLFGKNARGGAERVVSEEAAELARSGHVVSVIAGHAGRAEAAEQAGGVKAVFYRPRNLFFYSDLDRHSRPSRLLWHLADMFNFSSAASLRDILRRERPDVVHTHNLMGLGFLIPRMIRRLGVKHVHTVHDVQLIHPSGLISSDGSREGAVRRVYGRLMRRLMGSPAVVIFPSQFLKRLHEERGFFAASRRVVLPNPAPANRPSSGPAAVPARFLFAGQLEKHNGVLFLLDAWAKWEGAKRAELVIAGGGSLETEVRLRAAKMPGVSVLGRLGSEDLARQYAEASYVIVPSLVIENAPTVLLESFAAGTPAVAAASGGIPELVEDGRTGFLFKPGDDASCRSALERSLASLPDRPRFSAACLEKAGRSRIDRHVGILEGFYA